MSFQFHCPQGHLLEGDPTQVGQQCSCPVCGAAFLMPGPPNAAPPAAPAAMPAQVTPDPGFADPLGGMDDAALGIDNTEMSAGDPLAGFDDGSMGQTADPFGFTPPSPAQPSFEPGPSAPDPGLLHIACPNGHELETPHEMLEQDVMCPHCGVQFKLRERDSVESKEKRRKALDRRWQKIGDRWFIWSIVVAVFVVIGLIVMIVTSGQGK